MQIALVRNYFLKVLCAPGPHRDDPAHLIQVDGRKAQDCTPKEKSSEKPRNCPVKVSNGLVVANEYLTEASIVCDEGFLIEGTETNVAKGLNCAEGNLFKQTFHQLSDQGLSAVVEREDAVSEEKPQVAADVRDEIVPPVGVVVRLRVERVRVEVELDVRRVGLDRDGLDGADSAPEEIRQNLGSRNPFR